MTNETSLHGQAALVTGAATGIGRACALALAAAGADVVVNYLDQPEKATEVVAEITGQFGVRSLAVQADISSETDVERLFAAAVKGFGRLDILVSNAGIQADAKFADMSLRKWQQVIDVNLTGAFLCARAAVREFLRRGPDAGISSATGKIIFTSSVHQAIPWAGHANYAASKGGLVLLMKSIAQELAPQRIRVNAVAPGAVKTDINREAWETESARRELCRLIPYGRLGEGEDVGRAVAWLASDAADYITGTTLYIDGGMMLYPGFRTGG